MAMTVVRGIFHLLNLSNSKFCQQRPFYRLHQKMSQNCIFCKICAKQEPTEFLYEDEEVVVFKDIKPVAKHHYLTVSIQHIDNVNKLTLENKPLLEKMVAIGKRILEEKECDMNDVRLGFHCPPFNSIGHLHLHVIAPVSEMSYLNRGIYKPETLWFKSAENILQRISNSKM